MTWSPLACGVITGKYENGIPESSRASMKVRKFTETETGFKHLTVVHYKFVPFLQSYQWLKEKIVSDDGRKQQAKLKELNHIADKLGCTLPQLAVGENAAGALGRHTSCHNV